MRRRKWTFLLVSDHGDELRQLTVRGRTIRAALIGSALLIVAFFGFVGALSFHGGQSLRVAQLEEEKGILTSELSQIQTRIAGLEGDLGALAERDEQIRLLAGLDVLDEEVLQVGVGGPGSATLENYPLYTLNRDAGEQTFAIAYDLNALERRSRLLRESLIEASDSLVVHRDRLLAMPSLLPTPGRLTSHFSNARLHPIHNRELPHEGVDIAAPLGTPIMAAANGRISFTGRRAGYGLTVEIDHGFGLATRYAHASEVVVTRGQEVERGDVIARVGATGLATSPHLHYEVHVDRRPVNPMIYVIGGAVP